MKRLICLCAALCMLMTAAMADTDEQLLWAVEAAQECDLLAGVYAASGRSEESRAVADAWSAGDHASPSAVYRFTTDLDMYVITRIAGQGATQEQIPYLRHVAMKSAILYDGQSLHSIEAASGCQVFKSMIGECGYEWWLLCYDEGGDVLVGFMPYDNGTVFVNAAFWPKKGTDSLTGVTAALERCYGLASCEQIR